MSDKITKVDSNIALTKLDGFTNADEMLKWAAVVIDSGLLPHSITEPEQVLTIVQHGRELGITPHISLNNIHVISGRPTLSSAMLGSLLKRRGVEWVWDEDFATIKTESGEIERLSDGSTNKRTTIHFYWKSNITDRVMETTFSVTWMQMLLAGYTKKDNWNKYPKEMMRARALAYAVRAIFPEVLSGFYTELEIQDVLPENTLDINLNEDGDLILINNEE